tara:strand:+ start:213 stop:494 length:282 start_codon:yes stop_codon:yes gene_type:complete
MKIVIITILFFIHSLSVFANEEQSKCVSPLEKLKPSCLKIGNKIEKLKKFSKENKTIGQTLGIKKMEKKTLKEFAEENKTIDQTINNLKKRNK